MPRQYLQHTRGATLVELLVYLFLFALLTTGSLTLLFSLSDLFDQYRAKQLVFVSGTALVERVLTEVREADAVSLGDSIVGSSTAARLSLTKGVDSLVFERATTTAAAVVWDNGQYAGLLHSEAVTVTDMRFYLYQEGNIDLVRVVVTVVATVDDYTETLTLSGGAIVRESYVQP